MALSATAPFTKTRSVLWRSSRFTIGPEKNPIPVEPNWGYDCYCAVGMRHRQKYIAMINSHLALDFAVRRRPGFIGLQGWAALAVLSIAIGAALAFAL